MMRLFFVYVIFSSCYFLLWFRVCFLEFGFMRVWLNGFVFIVFRGFVEENLDKMVKWYWGGLLEMRRMFFFVWDRYFYRLVFYLG